jgi:glycine dehydrogenase subunit 1
MPFIPHTPKDIKDMLDVMNLKDINAIFDEIPSIIPKAQLSSLEEGLNEQTLLEHAEKMAQKNQALTCFMGAGCYDHHIPTAIWDIATRGEFLTSYTPYQAEVSQGSLQILYEFQSMISELFHLDVANASLYDGASALAEAILMAKRLQKKRIGNEVLIPHALHPHYRHVLESILKHQDIQLVELPFDKNHGVSSIEALEKINPGQAFALCMVQPNFFGSLEDVHALTDWAKAHDLISIACTNPISLGALTPPGLWGTSGVDIACGEGQPLGIPMSSGGPMVGLLACKKMHVRQMPGRIVGRTVDTQGRPGFALTLQAREQHIRRGKATSNICTNQGLNVTAATIFMSMMGPKGLETMAKACYQNTHALIQKLCQIPGVKQRFDAPFFHEAVIEFPVSIPYLCAHFENNNMLAGLALESYFPDLKNCLLICATEKRSSEDIQNYIQFTQQAINSRQKQSNACTLGA